jgi:signal transduction histidine kinase
LEKYFRELLDYLQSLEAILTRLTGGEAVSPEAIQNQIREQRKAKRIDFIVQDLDGLFAESNDGFDRIRNIVESIRRFSRVDSNQEFESFDLNLAIESTLVVANNEIKYSADVEKSFVQIPMVECNGSEINQVLLNIIVNAAQAIAGQKKTERGLIRIRTFADETFVYCEIADNGPGIPQEIRSKIFDPFFTTKEVGKGTGLGLSISYDIIINKHKGDLTVAGEMGAGTTFKLKLPIVSPLRKQEFQND